MAPPKKKANVTVSRPGRALAGLVVLIIVMLLAIVGSNAFSPGKWHHDFRVQLGLDLSSGTQVTLSAETLKNKTPSSSEMKEAISIMIARVNGAGFSGAQVQQQGAQDIVVTVPGQSANKVVGVTRSTFFSMASLIRSGWCSSAAARKPSPGTNMATKSVEPCLPN